MRFLKPALLFTILLSVLIWSFSPGAAVIAAKTNPAGLISQNAPATILNAASQNSSGYIYKYLIHRDTGGPVACGDTLFPVYVGKRTGDVKQDIRIALKSLFSTPSSTYGLYNPLAKSKLKVSGVEHNTKNANTTIRLSGRLVKPDNFCDIARARAMVWATAQQFPEVRHAKIFLRSALLGDLLAAKERAKP